MSQGQFYLSGDSFIIENYDRQPAFSSFLPGLAGVKGIPVWSFYTNRGQGINSFGIHNKGNAMMEFNPANTAYENTPVKGFRTFMRLKGQFFEPFCSYDPSAARRMEIEKNAVAIVEESHDIRITVRYFILPNESIGALVRQVTVENLGEELELELLDGMPQVIVYGVTNGQYKEMSNLLKSWVDIKNLERNAPLYTMRASSDDSAEVSEIEGGYYYCSVLEGALQPVLYDKSVIFGQDSSMQKPAVFMEEGLLGVREKSQCFANKVPCAFTAITHRLGKGEHISFTSYAGYAPSAELLNRKAQAFCGPGYAEEKLRDARALAESFTGDVWTKSAEPVFDQYIQQCYLDNFLRGGYPFIFGQGADKKVIHLFSRKHGDPERDYNFFSIAGEYYSQGNGNYRDVCQNRRNDVFFRPEVGDFNVRQFYNLVQLDGYNPLEIRPSTFVILPDRQREAGEILAAYVGTDREKLEKVIQKPFTPGQITTAIAAHGLALRGDEERLVEELLAISSQQQEAGFGEGYWSDHWDYNLDLIENYLLIYPEKKMELLFGDHSYRYYNSIGVVRPRRDTYVLNKGKVRQYGSMARCEEKLSIPGFDPAGTNWLMDQDGREVTTTLFGKLMTLAVNKFALLDSQGLGVEMEGGKPGWNDAMNGLPGLFGSSMPETLELQRLVKFLLETVRECLARRAIDERSAGEPERVESAGMGGIAGQDFPESGVTLCGELHDFMYDIDRAVSGETDDFARWDRVAALREQFREETKCRVSGESAFVSFGELERILRVYADKLQRAVEGALQIGNGIMPTYFTYEAKEYEVVKNDDGSDRISPYGLPSVQVKAFELQRLPYFLEGPARMLAGSEAGQRGDLAAMCAKLKETDLYDRKLKMYKTSASIEELSMENGRVRAFTPGWLERESVFLHMEYKYFYGLLKAGLYEEFYEAIHDALIPYQEPERYGRSILENSSFLASGVNPDPAVHGQGFVGRLSGSTVEMLSMWIGMFVGRGGFEARGGRVCLRLSPVLEGRMFDETGDISFTLCGRCRVTYHNPGRKNTYGADAVRVARMLVHLEEGDVEVDGCLLGESLALAVREGRVPAIEAWMEEGAGAFPLGRAICYSGYRRGQSPRTERYPSREQIAEDLRILTDYGFQYIRMYDPNEHARRVLEVIRDEKLSLRCMIGIDPMAEYNNPKCAWGKIYTEEELEAHRKRNDGQLRELITLANQYPQEIIAVSVGNENRPSWGCDLVPESRLIQWVRTLKSHVTQLVTYNEGASEWPQIPGLAEEVDVISIHSYPVWNRVSLEQAVDFNREALRRVRECYPEKQVIFTECGWPTQCDDSMDRTQVGPGMQRTYIQELTRWAGQEKIPLFLFEAFDEPWKGGGKEDEPEKHWGIFHEDRSPKSVKPSDLN